MSVASEINRIKSNIAAAYDEAEAKGANMPATENSDNLAQTVASIQSTPTLQSKTVTPTTSQQSVTPDSGYDGLSDVTVNATPLEAKTVTPTSQQQVVTPTAPNIGLSSVTVGAAVQPTLITKQITANGTYAAEDDNADGYGEVAVAVPDYMYKRINAIPYTFILTDENAINIQATVFGFDKGLTEIYFNCSFSINARYMFRECTRLEKVIFNNPQNKLNYDMFWLCTNLYQLDCPSTVATIEKYVFEQCVIFNTLVLRNNNVVTLNDVDAFNLTPFRNGAGGIVYVPQALISTYETATNWSALESTTFEAIEGSIYE